MLNKDFEDSKLIIKNSNIFFKNKHDEVLFINKILIMKYFYDNKSLQNKLISKNEIFNVPYSIEITKSNFEKKIFSKLNLNFFKLKINNELNYDNGIKKGLVKFTLNKEKFNATYDIKEGNFTFKLFDSLENSNFSYKGKVNFNPFYSNLEGIVKEIDYFHFLNSSSLILQLLKTEILNNKNLNSDINIHANEINDNRNFNKIFLNSKIQEGLIDIDNTKFSWKDFVDFVLKDSLIYVKDGELVLDGKLDLTINDSEEIYKFLLTPKNYRSDLKNIKANLIYNFDQKSITLSNILIDKKNNHDVSKILKSLVFKKNKLQNRSYLKGKLNKALKLYAG